MAYTLDMTKFVIVAGEAPASRSKREPEPNGLLEHVERSFNSDEWLILYGVPTANTIEVTNPITKETSKISEADVVERMLRRASRTLGIGIDITFEAAKKKGQTDVYFHARARRTRKAKTKE